MTAFEAIDWLRGLFSRCRLVVLVGASVLIAGCGDRIDDRIVVARVGPEAITADEFRLSYELGFPHLTAGVGSPRASYLDHMIDERLLALEGFRLGYDGLPPVQRQLASLRAELLVEEVFNEEVNERVHLSEVEMRAAVAMEGVRFKVRYLPASTLVEAKHLREIARSIGFDAAAARVATLFSEMPRELPALESSYLARNEIDPDLLEAVANLEVGTLSEPIAFRGAFIVIEVVDIRRSAVSSVANPTQRERIRHVQFQREAKKLAREFVTGTMQPVGLRLKAENYRRLRRHLWDWHRDAAPRGNLDHALMTANGPYADSIRAMRRETIMTTNTDSWTIGRFLREYPADRYPLSVRDADSFETTLYDAFGLTLRDQKLVELAEQRGLDRHPRFLAEFNRWQNKIVYRATLQVLQDAVEVSGSDVDHYYLQHVDHYRGSSSSDSREEIVDDVRRAKLRERLPQYLQTLRDRYPVVVDTSVLEGLDLRDPATPVAPAVTVVKGHTGRLAFPIVDPHW